MPDSMPHFSVGVGRSLSASLVRVFFLALIVGGCGIMDPGARAFDPAGGPGQEVRDVRAVDGRVFVLGDRVTSWGSTLSEFVNGKPVLRSDVPQALRPPLYRPRRFDQLYLVSGRLLYVGLDDAPEPVPGLVSYRIDDGHREFFAASGAIEELAESSECLYLEIVRPGTGRQIACFNVMESTFRWLPLVSKGQNVESLIPLGNGGLRAQIKLGNARRWFEWDLKRWAPSSLPPGGGPYSLQGWGGGTTMVRDTTGLLVDVRMVGPSAFALDRSNCRSVEVAVSVVTDELCFLATSGATTYALDSGGSGRLLPRIKPAQPVPTKGRVS